MKKVLITGANSYVGTNVEKWLMKEPDKFYVETLDMKDPSWREFDFSKFDVVFHVAGIVHLNENITNPRLYYDINRDLAIECATKALENNIHQFIFMSTMSIYGLLKGKISTDTEENPKNHYGKSKLQAEKSLMQLVTDNFIVSIIRPPMIYGYACPGNYMKLSKLVKNSLIVPKFSGVRSMIYIENLCEFIKLCIENPITKVYFPQNIDYVHITEMVKSIAKANQHKLLVVSGFSWLIRILFKRTYEKLYGTLIYDRRVSHQIENYQIVNFYESIKRSEKNKNVDFKIKEESDE